MALPEQRVSFRFSGGIETKLDPLGVPTTRLLELENGIFTRGISIAKRNGYEDIGQGIEASEESVTGVRRVATRGDELIEFTASRAYSRMSDGSRWTDTGAVYSAVGNDRPLVSTGTQQTNPDYAENRGVALSAWEDSAGGVWWSTVDATSGRVYRAPTQADAAGISPRCVAVGSVLHLYYAVPSAHHIHVIVVDPMNPSASASASVLVDNLDATDPNYDACPTTRDGSPAAIVWLDAGTTNINIGYVDQSGTIGTPLLGEASTITYAAGRSAGSPIAVAFHVVDGSTQDRFVVGFIEAGTLIARVAFFGGGSTSAAITFIGGNAAIDPTVSVQRIALTCVGDTVWSAWEESAAAASNHFVKVTSVTEAGGPTGLIGTIRSVGLTSRAFAIGSDAFAVFVHDTTFFNVYVTLRFSDATVDGFIPVGRHLPGQGAGLPAHKHLTSANVTGGGDTVKIALASRERLISENDDKFRATDIRLVTMDFDNDNSHQYAQFGRGLYVAGACPLHYDGRVWSELGFHVGPEVIATVPAAGGSMTASTTYEYRYWYEWTDAQGEVHPGPVSVGTLVTMAGGQTQVTHTLPTLRLTRKSGVRIMVARSIAGSSGNASQLWRATSLDTSTAGTANGYVANDPTVDTVTFIDRMSDTMLQTFDELYTDGGILSNDPTPLGSVIARGKERLFATDPSDGTIIRCSQPFQDGLGVQWPPELVAARVDLRSGSVTALAALDNRIIVWTERGIYTFAGDGPDATGSSDASGFSAVQTLPTDVGCTVPASVVNVPQGFLFKGDRGIWLIGNNFEVSYAGAPVEAYNSQSVRRATPLPNRTQVVFLTDSGLSLLYDHLFSQWSTFTNHEGVDSAVVSGEYHYIRSDGRAYRETVGSYSDAGEKIVLKLVTAWIHMVEHLQGWQKFHVIHVLGTRLSAHQLGVAYQSDYTQGWTDDVWFDATGSSTSAGWITGSNVVGLEPITGSVYSDGEYSAGVYGGTRPGEYAFRLDVYQDGESIQFRFQDFNADDEIGPSFELIELVITGQVLGNVRRPMSPGRAG